MNPSIPDGEKLKESHRLECQTASGGLPDSIWQTYSSFANTDGGTLLLGVRETNGHFSIEGLTDSQLDRYQRDFWNTLNNFQYPSESSRG